MQRGHGARKTCRSAIFLRDRVGLSPLFSKKFHHFGRPRRFSPLSRKLRVPLFPLPLFATKLHAACSSVPTVFQGRPRPISPCPLVVYRFASVHPLCGAKTNKNFKFVPTRLMGTNIHFSYHVFLYPITSGVSHTNRHPRQRNPKMIPSLRFVFVCLLLPLPRVRNPPQRCQKAKDSKQPTPTIAR